MALTDALPEMERELRFFPAAESPKTLKGYIFSLNAGRAAYSASPAPSRPVAGPRMKRHRVWFVDDLPSNREKFETDHREDFSVRTFEKPVDVLDAIRRDGPPDALLCDIYFYDTVDEAIEIESKVSAEATRLREVADSLDANRDDARQGIDLMEEVAKAFGGNTPFPIYAYTSKGPYLLGGPAFDRIVRSGAGWILKGKYDAGTERWVIDRDIRELTRNRLRNTVWRYLWVILVLTGVLGWFVGKGLEALGC